MPSRLCIHGGCPNAPSYRGYCPTHARDKERRTNRAGRAIYNTARWRHTRKRKLFETPLCEAEGCDEIATDVHHRIDLADGGNPWKLEGLEALCHSCHAKISRRTQVESVK